MNKKVGILSLSYGNYVSLEDYMKLQNNWNELKGWLEKEFKANENWYHNELTTHDKNYYKDEYLGMKNELLLIQSKMQEIESRK